MSSLVVPPLTTRSVRDPSAAVATAGAAATTLVLKKVKLRPVAAAAFTFLLAAAALAVGAAILAWTVLNRVGLVDHFEGLMVDLGFETFELHGEPLLRVLLLGAGVAVLAGTVVVVVATALFNLVNRLVGGISLRVVERGPRPAATREPPSCPCAESEGDRLRKVDVA